MSLLRSGLPPPPPAFGFDALKKLQRLAVGKGKSEELDAGQVVTRDDFRRGLMLWNQRPQGMVGKMLGKHQVIVESVIRCCKMYEASLS